jgi:type II secretory pathway component PulF
VEVLEVSAQMTEARPLAEALARLQQRCAAGGRLRETVEVEPAIPDLLRLVLVHTPETELARELAALQEFYLERAHQATRRAGIYWQTTALLIMGLLVAAVILSMFMPLIQLYQRFG